MSKLAHCIAQKQFVSSVITYFSSVDGDAISLAVYHPVTLKIQQEQTWILLLVRFILVVWVFD